jgi:cytochrome bd ubiquinol oxidase subunit II
MFEILDHIQLQQYWWLIMSIVAAALVFLLFVQGGQTLIDIVGKTENEKSLVITSVGRKWKLTFTTLIVFAAGMFASFPLFYSTSFGGAYYAWKIFLLCFVLQSIAFEFRKKKGNIFGARTYEYFLYINGFLGTLLLGAAVATFFTGSDFIRDTYNQSTWQTQFYGIEILFNFTNLALGLAIMFLARILGALYLINNVDNESIKTRSRKQVLWNTILFLPFFLYFVIRVLTMDGFAYDPQTKVVFMENFKYLHNFLEMPVVLIMFLLGVVGVLWGIVCAVFVKKDHGFWISGIGTFLTVLSVFLVLGYNNTCFYPSTADLQSSLTIENASSSKFTLTYMSYISLLLPVILWYIFVAFRALDKNKLSEKDITEDNDDEKIY